MRAEILNSLFADVETVPGVGKSLKSLLDNLGIRKVLDLVFHKPTGFIDRTYSPKLNEVREGETITVTVHVDKHMPPPSGAKYFARGRIPYKVSCHNDSGVLNLVFFNVKGDYLTKSLPVGEQRVISGKAEFFSGNLNITHPDYIVPVDKIGSVKKLDPTYALTAGITQKRISKMISSSLEKLPDLKEWISYEYLKENKWSGWKESLVSLHNPISENNIDPVGRVIRRLSYDEFLASQLSLAITRSKIHKTNSVKIEGDNFLNNKLSKILPYKLTNDQKKVISEISADMKSGERMLRLLQGDVGSGKTIVALISMLKVVECGKQAALMAPTEILSNQHYNTIKKFADEIGVRVAVVTGKTANGVKGEKAKREVLEKIRRGEINIVIGTHALFQEGMNFKDLALAVIDEQHRFGVAERLELASKGKDIHILLMSATPIPRTLTLTYYGDMDVSLIKEKPVGREPIDTRAVPSSRFNEIIDALKRAINDGNKVYWICPLVEVSEKIDLAAVESRYEEFKKIFGEEKVGLVHGRMKPDIRQTAMQEFAYGEKKILVATTVIEVGVDVKDATIMVIEHSERFGLSQLHQLRGRVGRGNKKSSCILLYTEPLGAIAKERLKTIRETEDGFKISEEDLRLRGGGEIMGTKQSGFPEFKIADISLNSDLLIDAREHAKEILENDPELSSERGQAIKNLLYIFEYDKQIAYIKAG